jgi:hypothetical protein
MCIYIDQNSEQELSTVKETKDLKKLLVQNLKLGLINQKTVQVYPKWSHQEILRQIE